MDYKASAQAVLDNIGGAENVASAAHCATRLRLVIADNSKCNVKALENIDGVKGVFESAGQLQIIFGTGTVNKVFEQFTQIGGITAGTKDDVKQAAAAQQNPFKRAIKTLGDIFVPIIPAIVASGLLMGLLEGFANMFPNLTNSGTYTIFHLFSNAAFVFLPILIAMSAAKVFGANIYLGAVIGMIMIHSDLMNAWAVSGLAASEIPKASVWFGAYDINLVGYQGHVIPVVIAVWLLAFIEKRLHKIVPEIIDLFVTPLVSVLVTGYLTLTIVGPVFATAENYVLDAARYIIQLPFGIGGLIIGGLYALTVVAGLHHMYNAVEAGLISSIGVNTWMPIATAANVAQGAAALAVAVKSRNKKTKSIALPAALSAYMGITEPAIFGVNIRYMKPFIAGCIGGAVGGALAGLFGIGATAYGITGVFGFLITTKFIAQYAIVMVVSSAVAFVASFIMYKEEGEEVAAVADVKAEVKAEVKEITTEKNTVYAPIKGNYIPLSEVKDETFASEVLGKGIGVIPTEGKVYAPFNGKVETIFDTKHAIGLLSEDGVEALIHVGINTVELNGQHFTAHVESGAEVKVGQLLLEFDIDAIKAAGYHIDTPVIITNHFDYENVEVAATGALNELERVMVVK